ncbi:MAG: hypothetical protein ACTHK2_05030 [Dokdonella sp.]|uniref:hypothetical protein n=1 Tax=Dokdonella sp. TaxID=2291710 RepID=UPI003F7E9696
MTTTRVYLSTDSGAPVVTGQVGTLSSALQTCLVGTAGVAYGSKASAGWTAPFTGTNKVALKNSVAAGGTGMLCRIDDNPPGAGAAREAFITCYFSMTDVDTGVGITPTAAQITGGGVLRKSSTADSTARAWAIVADELTWYMMIVSNASSANEVAVYGGGDFASDVASDPARFFCLAGTAVNSATGSQSAFTPQASFATPGSNNGLWLPQGYAGTGTAIRAGLLQLGPSGITGGGNMMADGSPGSNERSFFPALIAAESSIRGRLRGLYFALNNLTGTAVFTDIPGASGLPAGSVLKLGGVAASGNPGRVAIEAALAW